MPNRLAQETSPYLRQHAANPVDWYPWGEEALTRAAREGKPILLSVGYSACHWCHVMAHESFENEDVAALMNALFVNIKVDREERPDLDQIYQTAHQMLTQRSGGWPLTMFLMPDGTPFFGGTYFPREPRHNLPGFGALLRNIAQIYTTRQDDIAEQNRSLLAALARTVATGAAHHSEFSAQPLEDAVATLSANFDERYGGFGSAPKFPHPTDLMLLLRRHAATGEVRPRDMALLTLERMAEGGIFDQLGGGFSRYSVDAWWNIPHFEKMLYDNGPLLHLCSEAWLISGKPLFARTAETTAGWVMREMQSPEGGYYSALDADSEHEEGKFYVWDPAQVATLLEPDEYAVVAPLYGLNRPANFENKHWHFYITQPLATVAQALGKPLEECERLLTQARRKLTTCRDQRIRPGLDDKILTSWNALMITGMARAATVFGRPEWLASARRALDFIRATLWVEDSQGGRLLATCKDGRAHLNAYLDDYAFLLNALIEVMQADFRVEDLAFAEALADVLLEQFEDPQAGGFFFTSHDHERLIHRAKPGHDNATASGNGVAAYALQRLSHLTGEQRYQDAALRTLQLFYAQMVRQPAGFATLLMALEEFLQPPRTVILRGPQSQVEDWRARLVSEVAPQTLVLAVGNARTGLPPVLDKPLSEAVNAWVCSGVKCLAPITDFEELQQVCKSAELL